jgi:hypothetical protein
LTAAAALFASKVVTGALPTPIAAVATEQVDRQRDHAAEHDQPHRADMFDRLLTRIDEHAS